MSLPQSEHSWVYEGPGVRLDLFLSRETSESRAYVQEQIAKDQVQINGTIAARAADKVQPGDRVTALFTPRKGPALEPVQGNLEILLEDEHFLVLNKPAGVVVHPAPGTHGPTLVHYLLHHFGEEEAAQMRDATPERPGIVHRLDRGTSGCLIVAKNRPAQESLSRQFQDRVTRKEYEALAWGKIPARGEWKSTMGRDRKDRKKISTRTAQGREALTLFERIELFGHVTHVRLAPHTGRTHQLRVHLGEAGHPVLGDETYGGLLGRRPLPDPLRAAVAALEFTLLHAAAISFLHPATQTPVTVRAPRPAKFEELLAAFRLHDPRLPD